MKPSSGVKSVALIVLLTLQLPHAGRASPEVFSYRAHDLATLRNGFALPPREAHPWVYWFWWNSVVSREEIARELEELATAGFGGAEIRVVTFHGWGGKPLAGMDTANLERLGHRPLAYLSDEWVDVMEFTCAKAQKLGLRLALNLGQGWPPGGPWITDEHRTKHLTWKSHEVEGWTTFAQTDLPTNCLAFAWRLAGPAKSVATNSFQDLTRFIQRQEIRCSLRWEVPPGRWLVGIFSVTPGGICDKGEGPEVDPASREAVLFHLDYMFSRLDPKLRRFYGTTLVDMASDSWEYEAPRGGGRYWSPAILEAFPRQLGYDLRERMHALLDYGPDAERVRHDLQAVERRLVHENYFVTVRQFLHERGLRHRPQIYGRGLTRDLLEAYTLADTPEVEQGDYCVPEAPWAARTTAKPLITCEAFTHLHLKMGLVRRPHGEWESNPAHLRGAANYLFGEGVNRIQMHSFSYSPPGLPLPGWRMYAELHLNRNVPWWPDIKPLNTWLARQQWLLQAGSPIADALVYPVASNPDDGPFRTMGDCQPVSAANAVDAANAFTLPAVARALATGVYETNHLLLLDALKTPVEAQTVLAFLERGVRVICARSMPESWPALQPSEAAEWRERFKAAWGNGLVVDATAKGWKAVLVEAQSVRWTPSDAQLVFQHRRVSGGEIYLLFNCGDDFRGEVSFPHAGERVEHWDADTGRIAPVARLADRDDRVYVPLSLGHSESCAFVFSPSNRPVHVTQAPGGEFYYDDHRKLCGRFEDTGEYPQIRLSDGTGRNQVVAVPVPVEVRGPWQLSVSATQAVSPQPPLTLRLDHLVSWRDLPELKHFAGAATYTTTFELKPELIGDDRGLVLHLGAVFELARVSVNGREAGTAYAPPFRVDVTTLVNAGRNTLEIEVPNQLKNHLERGDHYRRASGLLGPVLLVPDRRITLADGRKTSPPPAKAPAAGSAGGPKEPTPRRLSPPSVSTADVRQTDIFRSGADGYHTYRIPALIESRQGTLLAFCEGRKNSDNDRGDIDLLLRRSTDGGQTWQWGDEILTAYNYSVWAPGTQGDPLKPPTFIRLARSTDGGLSWKHYDPPNFEGDGGVVSPPPAEGVDLTAPGFAFKVNTRAFPEGVKNGVYVGRNWFYSLDKGASWKGPFAFAGLWESPELKDVTGATATSRTDYLVLNRSTLLVFKSVPMSTPGRSLDKVFVAKTTDGGRTWRFLSWIVPTWDPYRAVMPSTVKSVSGDTLLCAIRRRSDDAGGAANWMDLYQSKDQGETWSFLSKIADCGGFNGNPPALTLLKNGTLACAYAVRGGSANLLKVQLSADGGRTWDRTVHVRDNLLQHNGYPRLFQRIDGKLCVVYMGDPLDGGVTRNVTHLHATVFGVPSFPPTDVTHLAAPTAPYRRGELETCQDGAHVFADQSFRLSAKTAPLPNEILGGTLIATANADRDLAANATLVSFTLGKPATVYVAHSQGGKDLPAWLKGWTDTGKDISIARAATPGMQYNWVDALSKDKPATPIPETVTFRLFQKPHPAGTVRLGGNDGGKTGAMMNYFVIVK